MSSLSVITNSASQTTELGRRLGGMLRPGDVLALYGDLGAGKTVLTKGLALGAGVEADISSPTFTLIHEHRGRMLFYHVDLYRIESPDLVPDLGLEEYLYGPGVTVVEWAEHMAGLLPETALDIRIAASSDEGRAIELIASSPRWDEALQELSEYAGSRA